MTQVDALKPDFALAGACKSRSQFALDTSRPQVVQADPRSTYRKDKCASEVYAFYLDNLDVSVQVRTNTTLPVYRCAITKCTRAYKPYMQTVLVKAHLAVAHLYRFYFEP